MKKTKGFVLKLDIEKVFDTINWNFIDYILRMKGYPRRWRKWIMAFVSNVQYSIIVNGKPHGRISPKRGSKTKRPHLSFIFVIAMDYLSRLLSHLKDKKAINGVIFNENCSINYLLFAYDILIFIEDNDTGLSNL